MVERGADVNAKEAVQYMEEEGEGISGGSSNVVPKMTFQKMKIVKVKSPSFVRNGIRIS